jgi:hypothetical protein
MVDIQAVRRGKVLELNKRRAMNGKLNVGLFYYFIVNSYPKVNFFYFRLPDCLRHGQVQACQGKWSALVQKVLHHITIGSVT